MIFHEIKKEGFEKVVHCRDAKTGLKSIIGIHSTHLGPAVGGCRMWKYDSEEAALQDVLRLSRGMTYKSALAGLNWGGGKAVIFGNQKTPELLDRYADFVSSLGGQYITAKDVGIEAEDLQRVKRGTPYVLGIEGEQGSSGSPSPATAWGVYQGLLACVDFAFGMKNLKGLTVAIQGLGSTSRYLIPYLKSESVRVIGCDIDPQATQYVVEHYGVEIVPPEEIYDVPCDIFSPSALGAILNSETIHRLRCKIVGGPANNQLAHSEDGYALMKRGIVYAPDYAINAGGITNVYYEQPSGYTREKAFAHIAKIRPIIYEILDRAASEKLPSNLIADRMAEEKLGLPRSKVH